MCKTIFERCVIGDTNMKFSVKLVHVFRNIFGYRDSSDLTLSVL